MTKSTITNETWIENLTIFLDAISSIEYQKRVWVDGEGPECDSLTETVETWISSLAWEEFFERRSDLKLSEDFELKLLRLNALIWRFVEYDYDPKNLSEEQHLKLASWKRIIVFAQEAKKQFESDRYPDK